MSSSSFSLIDTEQSGGDNSALIAATVLEFVLDDIFIPESSSKEAGIPETVSPASPPFNGGPVPMPSSQFLNNDSSGISSPLFISVKRGTSAVSHLPESNPSWVRKSQAGSPVVANPAEVTRLGDLPISAVVSSSSFSMLEKTPVISPSDTRKFTPKSQLEGGPGQSKGAEDIAQAQKYLSDSEVERSVNYDPYVGQLRKSISLSKSEGLSVSLLVKRTSACQPKILLTGNQSKNLETIYVGESEKCPSNNQLETSRPVSQSEEDMFADHTEKSQPVIQLERNQSPSNLERNSHVGRSKKSPSVSQPKRVLAGRHSKKRSVSQPEMALFGRLSKKSSFVRQVERVLSGSQSKKTQDDSQPERVRSGHQSRRSTSEKSPAVSQPERVMPVHRSKKSTSEKTPAVSQPERVLSGPPSSKSTSDKTPGVSQPVRVLSGNRSRKSTSFSQPERFLLPQSQPNESPPGNQLGKPIFDSAKECPSHSLPEKHTSVETRKTALISQPERNHPGGQSTKSQNSQPEGSGSADLFEMSPRASSSPDVLEDFPSSPQAFSSADEPASQDSLLVALREDAPSFRPVIVFCNFYFQWGWLKNLSTFANYFSVITAKPTVIFSA
jgi:hypothetical protein